MPTPCPAPVRIGPTGWNHPGWGHYVYPRPQPRSFHPLEFLARRFDTLEIPPTNPIRPELARLWAAKVAVNPSFQFTAQAWPEFTHDRKLDPARVREFVEGLQPLAEPNRLGCVLLDLPASFRYTAENRAFLIQLRRAFHMFPLVAELRHASWTGDEGLGTLIDHHLGMVNVDQAPAVWASRPGAWLTWRIGYVRLEGRRGSDSLYTLAELEEWKPRIERIRRFAESAFVLFANHGHGKSVVNALQMAGLISPGCPATGDLLQAPETLFDRRRQLAA